MRLRVLVLPLDEDATRCRYLLWDPYRRSYQHHKDALAVLDAIASAATVPVDLPAVEVLLEDATGFLYGEAAAQRLLAAADRHLVAGNAGGELRTLRKALAGRRTCPPDETCRAALDRADRLTSTHPGLPTAELGRLDVVAARLLSADSRPDEALNRIDRAAAAFEGVGFDVDQQNTAKKVRC